MGKQRSGVEVLRERIGAIVAHRQQLRTSGASPDSLEQNRLELVRTQSELSRALIEQHLPATAEAPA
jgi:hypothetical protein